MPKPDDIRRLGWTKNLYALARCPTCGREGWLDRGQYEGKISIDCDHCPYHETHDLREED